MSSRCALVNVWVEVFHRLGCASGLMYYPFDDGKPSHNATVFSALLVRKFWHRPYVTVARLLIVLPI